MAPRFRLPPHFSLGLFVIGLLLVAAGFTNWPQWLAGTPWYRHPFVGLGCLLLIAACTDAETWE